MAEAVSVLLENLRPFLQNEFGLFFGVKEEQEKISSKFTAIQAVLADAEMKGLTDMAIKDWLRKLEDTAYMMDDIIDECTTQDLQQGYQKQKRGWLNKVHYGSCHSSYGLKSVMFRRRIANKIKKISKRLDSIAEERKNFHPCETVAVNGKKAELMDWRQTTSVITQSEVYGREEDKEKIVQCLVGSDVKHFSVYPIVGIGGLGKTTLAQLVYNDDRVTLHFKLKIWVCVSEDFTLQRMIKEILESASGHACTDLGLEPLQKQLQQTLRGRQYLLVLDDVWSEDENKWNRLKSSLEACGSTGASVIVTTRLMKVASIMGTFPPHDLSYLSDDECWSLFKQKAFGPDAEENVDLAAIGKEIVKKCKGLPLAAQALGGLMRFKRKEEEWLDVRDSEIWNLQDENSILPALGLSYLNLPLVSRRCFSYCAVFQKDERIDKEELIHLWMANGFISSTGTRMAEDRGDEIIKELCWTSFFQDIEKDEFGNIKRFKIHDLLHDLAQFIMGDVCCRTDDARSIGDCKRIRHLTMVGDFVDKNEVLCQVQSLRTCHCTSRFRHLPSEILRFGSLRAFRIQIDVLPSSISDFKHLRYLNLSDSSITKLPESICSLWNLQSLNLNDCQSLKELPRNLKRLKALRHLYLTGCNSLSRMSPEMGQLTLLRTLNMYVVGSSKGFRLTELADLNLKGELHIKNLERVTSVADAQEANLIVKQLEVLDLSWEHNGQCEHILEALEPHPKLFSLRVEGYSGVSFPHWVGNPSFKNLFRITLTDCSHTVQLPQLGKLASLKELEISYMDHVRYVDEESYNGGAAGGFPSLESLVLQFMPNLEALSKEEGGDMFPCLYRLKIRLCPKLTLPSLSSVRNLTATADNGLLDSVHNLNGLEDLSFYREDDQELTSFPQGMLRDLACLKRLSFINFGKLSVLPAALTNMVALEDLHIYECRSLESLAEQVLNGLHSLQILDISVCDKFKGLSAGFQYLTSLKHLRIHNCPEVVVLSHDIQHIPPSLQSLWLCHLPSLECLPDSWGSLTSLQTLQISNCPKLKSLPSSTGWLASLTTLSIYDCPELQKRFQKETGQYWHLIADIPGVYADEFMVGTLDPREGF